MRHALTKAQSEHLRGIVSQIATLQGMASSFVDYVIKEAALPKAKQGWTLSDDFTSLLGEPMDESAGGDA